MNIFTTILNKISKQCPIIWFISGMQAWLSITKSNCFHEMVLAQLDSHMLKKKVGSLHIPYVKIKMDQKSKRKSWNIKLLEENTSVNLHDIVRQWFLRYDTRSTSEQKMKKDKLSFIKSVDFCPPKQRTWRGNPQSRRKYLQFMYQIRV